MESLLTPQETAEILRVKYHRVLDLIHLGELQAYKIGGQFRIPEYAIHEFLDKSKYHSHWKKQNN